LRTINSKFFCHQGHSFAGTWLTVGLPLARMFTRQPKTALEERRRARRLRRPSVARSVSVWSTGWRRWLTPESHHAPGSAPGPIRRSRSASCAGSPNAEKSSLRRGCSANGGGGRRRPWPIVLRCRRCIQG